LAPGACAGISAESEAGSPLGGPSAPKRGTFQADWRITTPPAWRVTSEIQSAGYARRRRLLRDCGRGFNSRRLHWFARDRQSGTCLHDSVISGWIVCDKCDIACRVFPANGADRVAGESQIDASGQSRASRTAVGARDQDTLASVTIAKARAHAAVTLVCRPLRASRAAPAGLFLSRAGSRPSRR
jgi:hypothetical protein